MRKKKEMPKPDVALKDFFKDNEIFAAVFNGYFFEGRNVIDSSKMEPRTDYWKN